jgi:hypothetical protein
MSVLTPTEKEAFTELRKIVRPGDTLYTVLRSVSRSGMSRSISVFKIDAKGPHRLDGLLAAALGYKFDCDNGGVKVGGAGMDMGFAVVYNLSAALYGHGTRGYGCRGDRCPSNRHVNDRNAPRGKGVRHRDGYAVSQEWL